MRKYYFAPNEWGYIDALKSLATAAGDYSGKRALLDDVRSGAELSPEERSVFNHYYHGDLRYLERRVADGRDQMNRLWGRMSTARVAAGVEAPSKEDKERFCRQLISLQANDDFRAKLHNWLNTIISRMKNGQEVILPNPEYEDSKDWKRLELPTIHDFLLRYDQLCEKRRGR